MDVLFLSIPFFFIVYSIVNLFRKDMYIILGVGTGASRINGSPRIVLSVILLILSIIAAYSFIKKILNSPLDGGSIVILVTVFPALAAAAFITPDSSRDNTVKNRKDSELMTIYTTMVSIGVLLLYILWGDSIDINKLSDSIFYFLETGNWP